MGTGRVSSNASLPGVGTTKLVNNYPNPFNPTTSIAFELAESGRVQLAIHDVQGRLVRTLISEVRNAGPGVEVWDGR